MTWEETLSGLQALLGRRVGIWVEDVDQPDNYLPGGFPPISPIEVGGVLRSGGENGFIRGIREAAPDAVPENEEVITFDVGDDETDITLTLTRSLFESAAPVYEGVSGVAVTQGSTVIHVVDQDELHAAAERLAAG